MKKFYVLTVCAGMAMNSAAQITADELAGKYHLQAEYQIWDGVKPSDVLAHDDFVFSLVPAGDNTFQLHSFFYNGMDEQFQRLDYCATAHYSEAERLLTIEQAPWMWDEYYGHFMESYGYSEGGPMMYFSVAQDPKTGEIKLSSTENSLGFFYSTYYQGQSSFVYAIDYPGVVKATKLSTYPTITPETLAGTYDFFFYDENGKAKQSWFTIEEQGGEFVMTSIVGWEVRFPIVWEEDRCGFYIPLDRTEENGRYTTYFGSIVGDCRASFHFDAEGRIVADNYITLTADFKSWIDMFRGYGVRHEAEGIEQIAVSTSSDRLYDLNGRQISQLAGLCIQNGRKMLK